jgi:hypothetical protein
VELDWNKHYQDSSIKNEFWWNKSSHDSCININCYTDYSSPGVMQHQANAITLEGKSDTKELCMNLYFVHIYAFKSGTLCYKNILNISHIPGNKTEPSARTEQRLGMDTAPTIYAKQTQLNVSIYVSRSFEQRQIF